MALDDILFQEGEGQEFIIERGAGTSNPALDILFEEDSTQFFVLEIPRIISGGVGEISNVFIN